MLNELIESKRSKPSDDFLSALILAEEEGEKLSNWEMCALIGESVCVNHFPFSFRQLDEGQEIFLVGNENVWWYQNRQEQQ